jgi:hypothetical protein
VSDDLRLVPYDGTSAADIVGWCAASAYSLEWVPAAASSPDAVLAEWHTDPDITGYVLLRAGTPVAYGELWVEATEAELAHLVVHPDLRRQASAGLWLSSWWRPLATRGSPTSFSACAPTTRSASPATPASASSA